MLVPLSLEWLDGFEHKKNFSDHYFILNSYFPSHISDLILTNSYCLSEYA